MMYDIAIIGAGPSGLTAAISAALLKKNIILLDKQNSIGRKLSVCGAGRCNFMNEKLNENYYNQDARELVKTVFSQFGKKEILEFFEKLGLKFYSDNGRYFPITNQSLSVIKILEVWLKKLAVTTELGFDVYDLVSARDGFLIKSKDSKKVECKKLIIASGGKTYPALASVESLYAKVAELGHSIITPVPSAVPLVIKDSFCHFLQGQKIFSKASCFIDGKLIAEASGEVLFVKYGLSGTAILDISEPVSIAINRHNAKNVKIEIDMVPFINTEKLQHEFGRRISNGFSGEELITGILPNKFTKVLKNLLLQAKVKDLTDLLKKKVFNVSGTRGWNEAEFTCGGIKVDEINEITLESKVRKNLYFAGEIIDVTGARGGYNLAFAWASGFISGKNA